MCVMCVVVLAGCGHNVMSFAQGKYINFGYDPNNSKIGLQYVNGSQITIVNRQNTKLTVQMEDGLDGSGKNTRKVSKIIYEIGDQKNGYNTK